MGVVKLAIGPWSPSVPGIYPTVLALAGLASVSHLCDSLSHMDETHGCRECGTQLAGQQQHYCSRACYADARRVHRKGPERAACERCGDTFTRIAYPNRDNPRRYCDDCRYRVSAAATAQAKAEKAPNDPQLVRLPDGREILTGHYIACEICGTLAYSPPSQKGRRVTCSRECMAERARGSPCPQRAPERSRTEFAHGYRDDLGHNCRSRWEANVARLFLALGWDYEYEPQRFEVRLLDGGRSSYLPDFLVAGRLWVEVKGRMRDRDRERGPVPFDVPVLRFCEVCGEFINSVSRKARYCSRQCAGVAKRKVGDVRPCPVCGDRMVFAPWEADERVTCSRECAAAFRKAS